MERRVSHVVDVAVVDPLPLFRAGVVEALSAAGHSVEEPGDLPTWIRRAGLSVAILTLESERDWSILATITAESSHLAVVALVLSADPASGARAVRLGAHSVLARATSAEGLQRAVKAAVEGFSLVPIGVLQELREGVSHEERASASLTDEQLSWLRDLAAGSTVTEIASRAGYSERAMYRMLNRVYAQLGAHNRTQALIRAQSLGWIGPA